MNVKAQTASNNVGQVQGDMSVKFRPRNYTCVSITFLRLMLKTLWKKFAWKVNKQFGSSTHKSRSQRPSIRRHNYQPLFSSVLSPTLFCSMRTLAVFHTGNSSNSCKIRRSRRHLLVDTSLSRCAKLEPDRRIILHTLRTNVESAGLHLDCRISVDIDIWQALSPLMCAQLKAANSSSAQLGSVGNVR